jgi:glutamine amidotransferase
VKLDETSLRARKGVTLKIPHLGWNQVKIEMQKEKNRMFDRINDNSYFYFVHSYYVEPDDRDVVAATTFYGKRFTSGIIKKNVWGVQFHPEKSSSDGLKVLENFYRFISKAE